MIFGLPWGLVSHIGTSGEVTDRKESEADVQNEIQADRFGDACENRVGL